MIVQQSWVDHSGIFIAIITLHWYLYKQLYCQRICALASLCPGPRFAVPKCWGSSTGMPRSKGSPVPPNEIYPVEASWKGFGCNFMDLHVVRRETLANGGFKPFVSFCDFMMVVYKCCTLYSHSALRNHFVKVCTSCINMNHDNQCKSQEWDRTHGQDLTVHFFKQWPFPNCSLRVGVMMCGWYLCCLPQLVRTYEPYSSNGDTVQKSGKSVQHSISIWASKSLGLKEQLHFLDSLPCWIRS